MSLLPLSTAWMAVTIGAATGCLQCGGHKCCGCRATANRGSVHSRARPNSGMENEALVVFARRRGPHDQSEDSAIHGRAHARARAIAQHRPQSDVHGAKSRDRRDPGGGTSNTFAIGSSQTNKISSFENATYMIQLNLEPLTGASQGIGRATALRLARDFSVVVLVARNRDNLERTAAEVRSLGSEAMVFALDLRKPNRESFIEGTVTLAESCTVNIAGAVPRIDLFQMTDAQWDDGMALKLNGARRSTSQAWDALKASTGLSCLSPEAELSIPNRVSQQSRRSMQPSMHWLRHSQSKESKTACRSTACRLEL